MGKAGCSEVKTIQVDVDTSPRFAKWWIKIAAAVETLSELA